MAANVAAIAWSSADEEFSFESMPSVGDDVSDVAAILIKMITIFNINWDSHNAFTLCSNKPFVTDGMDANGGIMGIAAAIGGNTPDMDDDVRAAIARAALAARL